MFCGSHWLLTAIPRWNAQAIHIGDLIGVCCTVYYTIRGLSKEKKFWGYSIITRIIVRTPQKSIGNYEGPYIATFRNLKE